MKLVGAFFVLFASGGIGFLFAQELVRRNKEMEELCQLLKTILGDIRYMRSTLPEAIGRAKKRHNGTYQLFLSEMEERLQQAQEGTFSQIWKVSVQNGLCTAALQDEDKQKMIRFGEAISSAEREMIILSFEQYIDELQHGIQEAQRTIKDKVKLYRSLGVLSGIFLVVLFL